jgi:hypothetical protein
VAGQEAVHRSEEARLAQLDRLKATVENLASRGDGRGLTDKYEFSLENQVSSRATVFLCFLCMLMWPSWPQQVINGNIIVACCAQCMTLL